MNTRRGSAAALCAAAVVLPGIIVGSPAAAHEAGVEVRPVVEGVVPAIAGLEVSAEPSVAPLLAVTNKTGETLTVLGLDGEPFLRIGSGRVEANRRSPAAYRAADPIDRSPLPADADPAADPEWVHLADAETWRWYDPRLRPPLAASPLPGEPAAWEIPARLDSRSLRITGRLERMEEHGHLITLLESVRPEIPALEIRFVDGPIPAIFVRNRTGRLLEIPGRTGEPFLRIGPGGVEGNTRSPSFYLSDPQRIREVPPDADPEAPPVWRRLSQNPVWAWLEERARIPETAETISLGDRREVVLRWTTVLLLDGEPIELTGAVEWVPAAAGGRRIAPAVWLAPLGAGGVAAAAALAVQRRRRGRRTQTNGSRMNAPGR